MLRNKVMDRYIASCYCSSDHIGSCFDLIRNDGIGISARKYRNALDTDRIRTGTFDIRSHSVQEVRYVNDMRFFRCILDDCKSVCLRSGKHQIDRRTDADYVEEDMCAIQFICHDTDNTIADICRSRALCAHFSESLQMQVNRTRAEIASSRHEHRCLLKARQQRTEKII